VAQQLPSSQKSNLTRQKHSRIKLKKTGEACYTDTEAENFYSKNSYKIIYVLRLICVPRWLVGKCHKEPQRVVDEKLVREKGEGKRRVRDNCARTE
jgi:hypothetical protein